MADPLAGLAARRAPEGTDNPDAVDIARLIAAVGGYIGKQLRKRAELRLSPPSQDYLDDLTAPESYGDTDRFPPTTDADRESSEAVDFLSRRYDGATTDATESERTRA